MSYDYQGIASVITASRHMGTHSDELLNEAVNIQLTSSGKPTIARLSFDAPLQWPAHPNAVVVNLPERACSRRSLTMMPCAWFNP
ncbi:hypothetical protein B1R45_15030 [Pseudomonas azotoformans]|uniref:hypothetical protein n=1 Tax=Pseudomonas azotoformans TaxID=47878 RepID=UPI00098F2651|nr:hypothetical protein [Pseudomonas azotoformans]AQT94527.1 hypothetical protein B1R45_15030 [Pseudomonas azotoformans]